MCAASDPARVKGDEERLVTAILVATFKQHRNRNGIPYMR
jgi:hypothetical protein